MILYQQSFGAPAVVATNVENMWSTSRTNQSKSQLMEALWLGCGAQGMKVRETDSDTEIDNLICTFHYIDLKFNFFSFWIISGVVTFIS